MQSSVQRNEVVGITTLLDGWSKVVRIVYRQLRRNGTWQLQDRDMLDRGHGVSVLLFNRERATVLLLRQPRIVATLAGDPTGETVEVCNGLMEGGSPLQCALREVEQEVGHQVTTLEPIAEVYGSPGGSLEIVYLFLGEYNDATQISEGGGLAHEGEDIEVFELQLTEALQWMVEGRIRDGRSMLLLQHLSLREGLALPAH
jgi:GDP-mannose pyrophosphatase NudK